MFVLSVKEISKDIFLPAKTMFVFIKKRSSDSPNELLIVFLSNWANWNSLSLYSGCESSNNLKQMLISKKFTFKSQTDTEVIVNLIEYNYRTTNDTFESIKKTIEMLRGTYGLVIQSLYEPNKLFCVRNGSPILVGQNDDMVIVTSEQSGFCNLISNYITLNTDDICIISKINDTVSFSTSQSYVKNNVSVLDSELSPSPYPHWTLKEIYEQPSVVLNSINKGGRIKNNSEVKLGGLEQCSENLKRINNIILLGCGTSYFAGQ